MRIMFSFLTFLLITITIKCQALNYCNSTICKNSKYDSFCKRQSSDPARYCIDVQEIIKTEHDREALLNKINSRRNKVASGEIRSLPSAADMWKLEWSNELAEKAQKWANQCIKTSMSDLKDPCRDIGNVSVGQNIATITGEAPGLILSALVDIWYMELLNFNTSILSAFRESTETGFQHYEYFTQLVWSKTRQVGCGGVKFKELHEGTENGQNRTVYRLVCNFMPSGNELNKYVYAHGLPCSQCPISICDDVYKNLCDSSSTNQNDISTEESTKRYSLKLATELIETVSIATHVEDSLATEDDTLTLFDFISHFHNFTIPTITITTQERNCNNNVLAVDDFVDLLKKKLSSDSAFKDLLFATKYPNNLNFTEVTLSDPHVASFVNRIYSKKEYSTTTKSTENDSFNSTLLVNLVEAVIFRSGDRIPTIGDFENTQVTSQVSAIKIQAELSQTQQNVEFSGHYFFPEDESDETTVETTEAYYDVSPPSAADIFMEIEDIKKGTTSNDFLDEILDFDSSTENLPIVNSITPGRMSTYGGRSVMKKFLEDIRTNTTDTTLWK